jgi:hypothetical protein
VSPTDSTKVTIRNVTAIVGLLVLTLLLAVGVLLIPHFTAKDNPQPPVSGSTAVPSLSPRPS